MLPQGETYLRPRERKPELAPPVKLSYRVKGGSKGEKKCPIEERWTLILRGGTRKTRLRGPYRIDWSGEIMFSWFEGGEELSQ